MHSLKNLLVLACAAGAALAQSASYTDSGITFQGITDPTYNVTYGFVFPPTTESDEATEFIGEVISPISNKWIGLALGGQMVGDLLAMMWPNGNEIMYSTRWATDYIQPQPYAGPTLSTISSTVNSTHWKTIFRCQNCTTWTNGGFDTDGAPVFAWAVSLTAVDDPSDVNSNFNEHDGFGFWGEITSDAHSADYDSYLTSGSS